RLAKFGVPIADTAAAGLAAAGIEPHLLPPIMPTAQQPALPAQPVQQAQPMQQQPQPQQQQQPQPQQQWQEQAQQEPAPTTHESPWFAPPQITQEAYDGSYSPTAYDTESAPTYVPPYGPDYSTPAAPEPEQAPAMMIPSGAPGRTRPLANGGVPGPRHPEPEPEPETQPLVDEAEFTQTAYEAFRTYAHENAEFPTPEQLDIHLSDIHGMSHPESGALARRLMPDFKHRYQRELEEEHIA
ncbi:hypothetical protein ACFSK2_38655, partial [Streptomyces beijiangensis]